MFRFTWDWDWTSNSKFSFRYALFPNVSCHILRSSSMVLCVHIPHHVEPFPNRSNTISYVGGRKTSMGFAVVKPGEQPIFMEGDEEMLDAIREHGMSALYPRRSLPMRVVNEIDEDDLGEYEAIYDLGAEEGNMDDIDAKYDFSSPAPRKYSIIGVDTRLDSDEGYDPLQPSLQRDAV
eukprot:m.579762 g.579762  ORF g.579762 m.579762 type:complete len:178 (-) comp22318_c2_seq1:486-1019(-)